MITNCIPSHRNCHGKKYHAETVGKNLNGSLADFYRKHSTCRHEPATTFPWQESVFPTKNLHTSISSSTHIKNIYLWSTLHMHHFGIIIMTWNMPENLWSTTNAFTFAQIWSRDATSFPRVIEVCKYINVRLDVKWFTSEIICQIIKTNKFDVISPSLHPCVTS